MHYGFGQFDQKIRLDFAIRYRYYSPEVATVPQLQREEILIQLLKFLKR